MSLSHIALIDDTKSLPVEILTLTSAALQKQATRDLGPIWKIEATVDYFPDMNNVPPGYWPIIIMDDIPSAAEGIHKSKNGQPFSLILNDEAWQLTCSHEMCEMLVDPFGDKTITSDSIAPGQNRVNYILEVCDPCGGQGFAYSVNGIPVCDFYTPQYFDPIGNIGARYSFNGAITKPREILRGGYLSWINPQDNKAYQANFFGSQIQITEVLNFQNTQGSLRSRIDHLTKNNIRKNLLKKYLKANKARLQQTINASQYTSENFKSELEKYRIGKKEIRGKK